jgi:SAM-dependent methyltransferase
MEAPEPTAYTEECREKGAAVTLSNSIFRQFFANDVHHVAGFHNTVGVHMLGASHALDIGCGDNGVLAIYRTPGREVWGTDFNVHPRMQYPEWFRLLGKHGKIPFEDAMFDLVICISVLEHVTDGKAFFSEVARVLKPSGHFIGHTISGDHYVTWIRRAFGLLPHTINQFIVKKLYGRDEVDTFPAFYRLNRRLEIDQAAHSAGLTRIGLLRYADQGYFSFCQPFVLVAMALDGVLAKLSSGWGRLYFTVILRKIQPPRT